MAEKKYFWLKLNEGFFRQKEIKKLRRIAGGDTYTIIYLKLLLRSLENNGFLYYEGIEPTFAEEIALDIDEDEENVSVTLSFLQSCGILEEKSEAEFYLITCGEMIGSETAAARRMRSKRNLAKLPEVQSLPENDAKQRNNVTRQRNKVTGNHNNVQNRYGDVQKCYTDIDKEQELQKEKEPYSEVVAYLNERAGTSYRATSKKTKDLIRARMKEGFTVDDFKTVIDKKCAGWLGDAKMERYLRPETLFGTKFEGYLNEKATKKPKPPAGGAQDDLDGLF